MKSAAEFDIHALYRALDEKRLSLGLSWQGATREINSQFSGISRPTAVSTITGMRAKRAIEGDGVLQMLRWLGRTPESFVRGYAAAPGAELPSIPSDRILRFDTKGIYEALNARREARGITWREVATEIGGINAPSLTNLSKGGRTGFPIVMRIARWLGCSAASLTYASRW